MRSRSAVRRQVIAMFALLPMLFASAVYAVVSTATPSLTRARIVDGPDVSSYQHPGNRGINWTAVRKSGREFAIVKATEGTSYVNPWFARDYRGIRLAHLTRGSYHFARPSRPVAASAYAQAQFYAAHIGNVRTAGTLPPILDLELTGGLPSNELVTWAQDFMLDLRQLTGRTPMLYTYPHFWQHELGDPAALGRFPLWMASYGERVHASAALWQYTATAAVHGILGSVDMSRLLVTGAWPSLTDGRRASAWPTAAPGKVQQFAATAAVHGAVVSWSPPDAGTAAIDRYVITTYPTGQVTTVGPFATSAFVHLPPGASSTVVVQAHNAYGNGSVATSAPLVPLTPTRLVTTTSTHAVNTGGTFTSTSMLTWTDTGRPIESSRMRVFTRPFGSSAWSLQSQPATDSSGRLVVTLSPTRSTQVLVSYPGGPGIAPAATVMTVLVRSTVNAWLSSWSVRAGHVAVLGGQAWPRFTGVTVVRQIWSRGHWVTVARTRTGRYGFFRFALRPNGRSTTAMRVLVDANHGHATSASNVVVLSVH